MKKLIFLLGVAVGFLVGSKVGREPYTQLEKKLREVANRPEVQDAMDKVKGAAQEQVHQFSGKVKDKFPINGGDGAQSGPASPSSVLQRSAT